jgi:hypothetical protein
MCFTLQFSKTGPSWSYHSLLQKIQFHLNRNKHATNLQETISVSKGSWKVCTIDEYSPSKYDPGVSFNHFSNGPWTFMIKEQNTNLNHCFKCYCQYSLVTKMNKLNVHKTKFYKVQTDIPQLTKYFLEHYICITVYSCTFYCNYQLNCCLLNCKVTCQKMCANRAFLYRVQWQWKWFKTHHNCAPRIHEVIYSKAYRSYVKPRIIPNTTYNVIFV